jgi:enoyl-CoA hydratase
MASTVRYEPAGDGVVVIRMDDGKVNAINPTLLGDLGHALLRAQTEEARAVVLAGREGCFSAGLDLKTLPALPPQALRDALSAFADMLVGLLTFPRPVVALSTGHAIAGGAVLLLCCDRRIAVEGAYQTGLREVAVGIPMPDAVSELAKLWVPPRRWMEAIAHGRLYDQLHAIDAGFIDVVAPAEDAERRALAEAARLADLPNPAYERTKRYLRKDVLKALEGGVLVELGLLDSPV